MPSSSLDTVQLAPVGSTGNNTHTGQFCGDGYIGIALEFVVEAVGGTPTVTFKFQGSQVGGSTATDWHDLAYVTDATDTLSVSTRVVTAVGRYMNFLANPSARRYRYFRVITSSNTNVTYSAVARPFT